MSQRRARATGLARRAAARLAAFPALVLVCAVAGCNNTAADCYAIHPGNRIAITVVDVYESNPYGTQFPCPTFDPLEQAVLAALQPIR